MFRHCLAVAIVVCLRVSSASAQPSVLTINVASADIHKSPTVASPVIGQAARGRELEILRDLGDWARVIWPTAPDARGYVRLSLGTLGTPAAGTSVTPRMTNPAGPSMAEIRNQVAGVDRSVFPVQQPLSSEYVDPPAHRIGVGGLMTGSTIGFGATGRFWTRGRLALQLEASRYSLANAPAPGHVSSFQFAPGVLLSLRNQIDNALWTRPYVGGGVKLSHSTLKIDGATAMSENQTSWQVFGGSELTLPGAPRFALSGDVRYDSSSTPFAGYDFGGVGFSISGHWYLR